VQRARAFHAVTAAVAGFAVAFQLLLVWQGGRVLDETGQPDPLGTRLWHFIAYFTVQSNILVAVTAAQLARDPARDGRVWRVFRLMAVVGITVTGVVHFLLLRPLLDLSGSDYVADKLLHMVVPALAFVGWALFGPRPRIDWRDVGWALCWPLAWLAVILVVGAATGWYPYPFLDHREPDGAAGVLIASVGITAFFLLLFWLGRLVDRRATVAP
jgi:hypothetical protein